jgi:hypothetical protein
VILGLADEATPVDKKNLSPKERRRRRYRARRVAMSPLQREALNKRRREGRAAKRLFQTPQTRRKINLNSLLLKRMKRRKNPVLLSIRSRGSTAQPRVHPQHHLFLSTVSSAYRPDPIAPSHSSRAAAAGSLPSHAAAAPSPSSIANPPPVAPNESSHPLGHQACHRHPPVHQPSVRIAPLPPSIIIAPSRPRLRSAAPRTPGRSSAQEGSSTGQPPLARRRRGRVEASRAWDLRRPYQPRPRGDGASLLHDAPPPHSPPSTSRHLTRLPPRVSPCVPPPHLDHTHSAGSSIIIEPILKQIKIHCR